MFINSHIATGYIASWFETDKKEWIFLWIFAAFVPDIDGLWSKTVVDHHSVLHTPIFWIVFCGIGWLIGWLRDDKNDRFVPNGMDGRPFNIFESGGSTGLP